MKGSCSGSEFENSAFACMSYFKCGSSHRSKYCTCGPWPSHNIVTKTSACVVFACSLVVQQHVGVLTMGVHAYSPCNFFRHGIAHLFLLGVLYDFWKLWLHPVSKATECAGFVLATHIRQAITARGRHIVLTTLFGKPYTDLIKCASCS